MIINLSKQILSISGQPILSRGPQVFDQGRPVTDAAGNLAFGKGEPYTIGKICIEALTNTYQDETDLSGQEKFERWNLAQKLHGENQAEISVEEATLIKTLVGKGYGPVIVGPVYTAIDKIKRVKNPK